MLKKEFWIASSCHWSYHSIYLIWCYTIVFENFDVNIGDV